MPRALSLLLPLLILLSVSPALHGHLSFNLVVDEQGSVYFLEIFKNNLVKVTSDGEVSVLTDLRKIEPEERLHALAMGQKGDLQVGGPA